MELGIRLNWKGGMHVNELAGDWKGSDSFITEGWLPEDSNIQLEGQKPQFLTTSHLIPKTT